MSSRFQAKGRQTSPSFAASMKHHLQLHCQLDECNLLVRTSAADPIKNTCVLDHSRCDQLAWYSWPRRRARLALPGKACRHHPVLCAGRGPRGVASPPTVSPQPWSEACRPCTRAGRAAATGRLEAPSPSLPWLVAASAQFVRPLAHSLSAHFHAAARPTSPSVVDSMKHHLRLHCQYFPCTYFSP